MVLDTLSIHMSWRVMPDIIHLVLIDVEVHIRCIVTYIRVNALFTPIAVLLQWLPMRGFDRVWFRFRLFLLVLFWDYLHVVDLLRRGALKQLWH